MTPAEIQTDNEIAHWCQDCCWPIDECTCPCWLCDDGGVVAPQEIPGARDYVDYEPWEWVVCPG
jgi:hypothetical protein